MSVETIIYKGRVSKMSYLPWLFLPAFVGIFFLFSLISVITGKNSTLGTVLPFAIFELLVSVPFLNSYIKSLTAGFLVTDKRIIYKSGVLTRVTLEQYLSKIESCEVEQSIPGRLLDYGTIIIRGTGGTPTRLPAIDSPLAIRAGIIKAIFSKNKK